MRLRKGTFLNLIKMISARFINHEVSLLPALLSSLEMSHRVQPTLKGRGMKLPLLGGACVRWNSTEELRAFFHIYSFIQLFIRNKWIHGFSGSQFKAIIQASASELALVFLCPLANLYLLFCLSLFLSTPYFRELQDASGSFCIVPAQPQNQPSLQGVRVPFTGKWCLETKIWPWECSFPRSVIASGHS